MNGKLPKIADKDMERQIVAFTATLRPNMTTEEISALYEQVERDHWLCESKLVLMRTVFASTLNAIFEKEDKEAAEGMAPMFQ